MHVGNALIKHVRSLPEQAVDGAVYHFLVARHGRRGQYYRVARHYTNLPVVLVSDTRQGRGWLSLASRTDDDHLLWMKLVNILHANDHPFGDIQVTQINCHLDVVDHTATGQRNETFVTRRCLHYLLHP